MFCGALFSPKIYIFLLGTYSMFPCSFVSQEQGAQLARNYVSWKEISKHFIIIGESAIGCYSLRQDTDEYFGTGIIVVLLKYTSTILVTGICL